MSSNYSIRYDLSHCSTDAQRRILAWPDQWAEFGLGDYGPGLRRPVDCDDGGPGASAPAKL